MKREEPSREGGPDAGNHQSSHEPRQGAGRPVTTEVESDKHEGKVIIPNGGLFAREAPRKIARYAGEPSPE